MEDIRDDIIEVVEVKQALPTTTDVNIAVDSVKGQIVEGAINNVKDGNKISKHSKNLSDIADSAITAEIEKERLKVEQTKADNKAEKQEIKNRLIALKTEAIRLKREHKQILKEQKNDHKKRNKDILWQTYEKKLDKMGYTYVPNKFILSMLLFFDGVVGFFEGLGKVSTAIMKALKWIIIIGLLIALLMIIPATREWLLEILGFIG